MFTRLKRWFGADKIDTTTGVLGIAALVCGGLEIVEVNQWFAAFIVVFLIGFYRRVRESNCDC